MRTLNDLFEDMINVNSLDSYTRLLLIKFYRGEELDGRQRNILVKNGLIKWSRRGMRLTAGGMDAAKKLVPDMKKKSVPVPVTTGSRSWRNGD